MPMKSLSSLSRVATPAIFAALLSTPLLFPSGGVAAGTGRPDWLLDNASYKAGVHRAKGNDEIVLSNGLISRTFRLAPNAATVGFDNLITGQSLIRGVKPEALVTIDGVTYEVGGLKGQPNYAFLRPEWVDQLKASPNAMQFAGVEVGKPKERMAWNRVRHHAPGLEWPPKGVYLRMEYKMPDPVVGGPGSFAVASPLGRANLIADDFKKLDGVWKVHTSTSHERSSFINEGKTGEIYTPANTAVFAQRDLPADTRLVEVEIDAGTDTSASWGPGIVLVWNSRVIKFYLRPGGNAHDNGIAMFGLFDGHREKAPVGGAKKVDLSKSWTLRLRMEGDSVYAEAKPKDGLWKTYEKIALAPDAGAPNAVRIGKTSKTGGADDFGEPGEMVRLNIMRFAAYGPINEKVLAGKGAANAKANDIRVSVHYELYDGLPVLSKWITVHNNTDRTIKLNRFTCETLAAVEYGSAVEDRGVGFSPPNIHVETDYAFSGMTAANTARHSVHWVSDPQYKSQVNWLRQNPCLLEVRPTVGPDASIAPADTFESFHAFVLPFDSYDRDRNGLALRRMYRIIAPWVTENPLMMHVRWSDWKSVKNAIDQCAEVGFEMVILTFGSGFNIENESEDYLAQMKKYSDYAASKGIEIGGYSLLASRRVGGGNDVVMPAGQSPTFGNSPCIGSKWGQDYFRKLYQFYEKTGFMLLEHDGSYPGDVCTSPDHPGHDGYGDSRWTQWKVVSDFYKWCRGRGIYLNIPDYYYLAGSNKCGMGYREVNWSLPRAQQVIHTRQNIFDGAWQKTPSMGWMFVPLTQYQGGGAAATIEPLNEHLDHYKRMIASNLGAGVQACYRGPRLYDTDETKAMVKAQVDWFKAHREVLEGDLIHLRRADGRDIDYWLNVNPGGKEKGLLMVYNPLDHAVCKTINIPLYYTGLIDKARIHQEDGAGKEYTLRRDYSIDLEVTVPEKGVTWFVIE